MVGAARPPSEATESAGCGRSQLSPRLLSMPQPSLAACARRFYQRLTPLSIWHSSGIRRPWSSHSGATAILRRWSGKRPGFGMRNAQMISLVF